MHSVIACSAFGVSGAFVNAASAFGDCSACCFGDRAVDGDSELSTGRMDPRVGSGRVGSRFCRILAGRVGLGRVSTSDFLFFTDYSLVPESI